jgi:oligopeptide/dipeptide ABC transporter ATP-binding protein
VATTVTRPSDGRPLVEVADLHVRFPAGRNVWGRPSAWVQAVDGVSLTVGRGEVLGLVGETGSGKTTLGRCLVRLQEPVSGSILFDGEDLLALKGRALREKRREFQIVFQDPYGSLDPRMTVEAIVGEPLLIHRVGGRAARRERVAELLAQVGLERDAMGRYPAEFSGGQRQRIGIARAIALKPRFLVCDEPVSALDVSVQAQIVNLLQDLQEANGLSYLFIAHGLQVVSHISHRVAVMYLGKIVELAGTEALFRRPLHPYTRALLAAVPEPEPGASPAGGRLQGEPAAVPASGCPFAPRCPLVQERCRGEAPALSGFGDGHLAACHFAGEA